LNPVELSRVLANSRGVSRRLSLGQQTRQMNDRMTPVMVMCWRLCTWPSDRFAP